MPTLKLSENIDQIQFQESITPIDLPSSASGWYIYFKSDGNLYKMDNAGTETLVSGSLATSLDIKNSVRVATTADGALATEYENGDTIDGVVLVTNDRILIKDQSDGSENGIYTVNVSGAPTRSTDCDEDSEVTSGLYTFVEEGTANADSGFILTTNNPIVVDTTALTFARFSAIGKVAFLDTANTFSVGPQTIEGANGLDINPGSDIDADILTVGVTGTPKLWWDESDTRFRFSEGLIIKATENLLDSDAMLWVQGTGYPSVILERTSLASDLAYTSFTLLGTKSTNMGPGFGAGFEGSGRDDEGTIRRFGAFSFFRGNADTEGEIEILCGTAGNEVVMTFTQDLEVGIGQRNPAAKLDVYQSDASGAIPGLLVTQADTDVYDAEFAGGTGINLTTGSYYLNDVDINTAGALSNVAYLDQANTFSIGPQTIDGSSDAVQLTVQGHSTQTSNMQEWQNSGSSVLASINGSGFLGIGGLADSQTAIRLAKTFSSGSSTHSAVLLEPIYSYSTSSTQVGVKIEARSISGTTGPLIGINGITRLQSASATLSDARGASFRLHNGIAGGTITNGYNFYIQAPTNDGTITNLYGLYVESLSAGATSNYAIYTNAGYNYFGDRVGINQPSPAAQLDVYQSDESGAIPGLLVTQDDTSEPAAVFMGGNLGVGVADPDEQLELTGRLHLGQTSAPGTVTDKLYNVAGNLHWNGAVVGGALFSQTANQTVANTTVETTLVGTGVGSMTLPANFLAIGKTIRIRASGIRSTHSTAGNITFRIKFGSTVITATATAAAVNSLTNRVWRIQADITCRTTGATGTVRGQGVLNATTGNTSSTTWGMPSTADVTIDTTATQAVSATIQWATANAANTITCTNFTLQALN